MESKLYDLLCNIEDFLISIIDSDPEYRKFDSVEAYMNSKDPAIASLYHCFQKLADKFMN